MEAQQKTLLILNDPPYWTERSYNGLRLATELSKGETDDVRVFLIGDAVACAKRKQKTPDGFYNLERRHLVAGRRQVTIGACGSCLAARGIDGAELADGVHRSSMEELAYWTRWADKVVVF